MKNIKPFMLASIIFSAIITGCINTSKVQNEKPKPMIVNISVGQGNVMTEERSLFLIIDSQNPERI